MQVIYAFIVLIILLFTHEAIMLDVICTLCQGYRDEEVKSVENPHIWTAESKYDSKPRDLKSSISDNFILVRVLKFLLDS